MQTIPTYRIRRAEVIERPVPEISVVVPLFNERENVPELYRRLRESLATIACEIVLIDDGSSDSTPQLLDELAANDPHVVAIHLSRNFGHQAAVSAGLDHATGQAVIVMDGDLQDPPEVLAQFIAKWREGHDVVYAVRTKRKEGLLKRAAYFSFYRLLRAIGDIDIPLDSGDFCLMDRKVVDVLRHLPERVRFVRGLRTFVGFRQVGLIYERDARAAGTPKYTFRQLIGLATDGIVNFSSYPLRAISYCGIVAMIMAMLASGWLSVEATRTGAVPSGWSVLAAIVLFMGATQLLSLGILGQYICRIFIEVKGRPNYIIRDIRIGQPEIVPIRVAR